VTAGTGNNFGSRKSEGRAAAVKEMKKEGR